MGMTPAGRLRQYVKILKTSRPAVGAIFFPIQQLVEQEYPAAADYLRAEHFWVGNHTWSHKDLSESKTEAEIEQEIRKGTRSNILRPALWSHRQQGGADRRATQPPDMLVEPRPRHGG
jgi:peptidoglycan/xylan/chitin deacetylase (PgdA/CDA1 family)